MSYVRSNHDEGEPFSRTRVYHDGWLGYNFLHQENSEYEGFTIIHEGGNFGEGCNSTNRIEGYWSDLRRETCFNKGFHPNSLLEVKI